jgi:uncharacterized cupredoxin-like copper-binding protein
MLRRLLILIGCIAALAIVVAACETDDNDVEPDAPGVADVTPTPDDDDDVATPDAATPDATPDVTPDDATPEATPDATPEDTTPEATPEETPDATPDTTPDATPDATPGPEDVEVEYTVILDDFDIEIENGDLLDDLTTFTIQAGVVQFNVENEGDMSHSLAIERRVDDDDDDNATPTPEATPGMMDEDLVWDETLDAGESGTWIVRLEPGEYVLYCPIGNHRDEGMEIEITVEENDDD